MFISGSWRCRIGSHSARCILFALPILAIPACALFHHEPPLQVEPPQLLIDPYLDKVVAAGGESSGWRFDVDPATPGLRTGPMMIRRTCGLGISQDSSRSDRGEVNALIQQIEDPPVGEWYRFYLEFGVEKVSPEGVRIDLRFYDAADGLIESNGWSPEVAGTVPFYWGEAVGEIPAGCARMEVIAGLDRSASGTFVLQEARLELHDPVIQAILTDETRFVEGKLHLVLKPSSRDRISLTVDLESGAWNPPYSAVASFFRYTLRGRSLDLKLDQGIPYREESGYELIGTRTWWIRGDFDEQTPGTVGGSFYGTFITISTMPDTRYNDLEGTVTGYFTLNGSRVDSLQIQPLQQGRRPPPDRLRF